MGLSNKLSCDAGSFCHCNPHRSLQPEVLRLSFPALEPWVLWSVSLPSCSPGLSACKCGTANCHLACPILQLPPCHGSSPPQLPYSPPPTSLEECFFFNSLVVGLPYSSIFWQFCLLLFFNLLLSFFWLWEEAKCIYLCLHLGQKLRAIFKKLFRFPI